MATYNKFQSFVEEVLKGTHDFDNHDFNLILSNAAPDSAADEITSDITQIAEDGGYTAGGYQLDNVALSRTGGVAKVVADDFTITAVAEEMAPFRYVIIRNATASGGPLVAWYDYGTSLTLEEGESLTVDFNQTNGIFTLT